MGSSEVELLINELAYGLPYYNLALMDSALYKKKTAAKSLVKMGYAAIEPLIEVLENSYNGSKRWYAAEILGQIGDACAVEPLIRALGDESFYLRVRAAEALGKIGDSRAVESLIMLLRDGNGFVRGEAAEALGKINDARAVKPLIRALGSDRLANDVPNVLYSNDDPAGALNNQRNDLFYQSRTMLNRPSAYAAKALGKIGDARAVEPLIKALRNSDEYVRSNAANALENIINSNQPLFALHPHLLCKECFLRSKKERATAGVFKSYTYIACHCCKGSINLLRNVKQAIGLIGGDVKDYKQDGDKVYVNLWFESEKRARNADIDILEISESDGVSYDYAVNAVLNVLKNDVSRSSKYVKNIPVVIKGSPILSENSKMILEHEFGGIRKEYE